MRIPHVTREQFIAAIRRRNYASAHFLCIAFGWTTYGPARWSK